MNIAIQKTLAFLILIGLGLLLRKKLKGSEQLAGIKMLILSVALPAMIFVALLNTEVEAKLFYLPVLALLFNIAMALLCYAFLPFFGIERDSSANRTLTMLLPSLAPGLSCFPYVLEYLGNEMFAWSALADLGNKIFVLIILYMVAMHWYYQRQSAEAQVNRKEKLKQLGISLIEEPVNLVIITALAMLAIGLNYASIPPMFQDAVNRLSAMMTPLVLLFIGLAVKVNRSQFRTISGILLWRAGITFFLSALLVLFMPAGTPAAVLLLIVVFPQSSASFWPFAHISAISSMEDKSETRLKGHTFDKDLALGVLAFSLPFSTMIILMVCSVGTFFTSPLNLLATGLVLFASGSLIFILKKLKDRSEIRASLAKEEIVIEKA
jgi:predicted permease